MPIESLWVRSLARAAQASEDVAAADDHPDLHAGFVQLTELGRRGLERLGVDAKAALFAAQRFTAQLDDDAAITQVRLCGLHAYFLTPEGPTLQRARCPAAARARLPCASFRHSRVRFDFVRRPNGRA
jgi:hypothetical protein